jgi:hypothetical protein
VSKTIAELRNTPDDVLITKHDALASNTVVGVSYYLDEIRRREATRQGDRLERLTRAMAWMTGVITVATIINLLVFIFGT